MAAATKFDRSAVRRITLYKRRGQASSITQTPTLIWLSRWEHAAPTPPPPSSLHRIAVRNVHVWSSINIHKSIQFPSPIDVKMEE